MVRGNGKDVILQAFHWNLVKTQGTGTVDGQNKSWYAILTELVPKIATAGFTVVYLPPAWRDDSSWSHSGRYGGGEGYYWHDFDLNSRYGTKNELATLISALHAKKIRVIVDLVTNHRDGNRMQKDVWPYPGECWARGGRDSGGSFMGGDYDLNLSNPIVHNRIREAMEEMMDIGVDGWRWDYVWGYEVHEVVSWIKATKKDEYISIGEYWQDSPNISGDPMVQRYGADEGKRILGWANESGGCAFDIILKRNINTANPANLKYGLNLSENADARSAVVTFVDNHDMGASPWSAANGWGQQCWPCPPSFKSKAYAFILTTPGTPCVYWPDWYDWGHASEINELIAIRKQAEITSASVWKHAPGEHGGIAGYVCDEKGKEKIALSIGSFFIADDNWEKAYEKDGNYTVWLRR